MRGVRACQLFRASEDGGPIFTERERHRYRETKLEKISCIEHPRQVDITPVIAITCIGVPNNGKRAGRVNRAVHVGLERPLSVSRFS